MVKIEYSSRAGKIDSLITGKGFPLCVCGEIFEVKNIFTQSGEMWGASADCRRCKEHFFQGSYEELKRNIPSGQEARALAKNLNRNANGK